MFQKLWRTVFGNWPMTKRNMFIVILLLMGVTAALFSLLTRVTVLDLDYSNPFKIAVVGPMEGPDAATGAAMVRGAELAAQQTNDAGGIRGRAVIVDTYDDGNDPAKATEIANSIAGTDETVAVIGHWAPDATAAAEPIYEAAGIPMISTAPSLTRSEEETREWVFRTVYDDLEQTQFLANYLRNVVGQETVSIIHEDTDRGRALAEAFDATYRRFGTKVLNFWTYDPNDLSGLLERGEAIATEMRELKLTGHIFVQGGAPQSARIVTALRQGKVRNGIVGLSDMATAAFVSEIQSVLPEGEPAASISNGIFVTTPLLFDTATEVAQNFRTDHITRYGTIPDWTAAFAFDATRLSVDGLIANLGEETAEGEGESVVSADTEHLRHAVRDYLLGFDHPERAHRVVGGERYFGPGGQNKTSVQIGLYNGDSMISALTQLQPILERGVTGFLDLVQQGKVLYVNDRFMYRTNVVYTGVQLLNVEPVYETQGEDTFMLEDRFEIDFLIWFRYRGDFEPQDVVFLNAVEPVELVEADKTGQDGDLKYVSYRVNGNFKLEFSNIHHAYGTLLTGLGFHHRLLSRNNLMYVTDVLGMGLVKARADGEGAAQDSVDISEAAGWLETLGLEDVNLAALVGEGASGDPLMDGLSERRVFAALPDLRPERSWISQEIFEGTGEGDPAFIGFGKQAAEFTRIDLGVILGPAGIDPGAAIPYNWFVYLFIFSLVALLFAAIMDRKDRGQFWRFQTLGIRAFGWPVLLISSSTLVLDYSAQNLPDALTDGIVLFFDTLWWMIPARLIVITLERFLWVPVEEKSGRRIPNVVRLFASGSVYLLAVFGVVAFVFDQKLTSLLATSGLLAMIIGLAIQANIANIFSGIVLNIERPFKVGDWVMVDEMIGLVTDITWRTMRLKTRDGYHVSIPNGQVSEAIIQNYSTGDMVRFSAEFFVPDRFRPDVAEASIARAEARIRRKLEERFDRDDALDDYTWRYDGIKVFELGLFHRFRVDFWIDEYNDFEVVRETVYAEVFDQFGEDGIEQGPAPTEIELVRSKAKDETAPTAASGSNPTGAEPLGAMATGNAAE